MSDHKVLLFVGAHPDDETFGVGGTLAQYAAQGVAVYYAVATRGEVGSVEPEQLKGYATIADLRWSELECAIKTLGLAGIRYLGYRDSGMPGTEDNRHSQALVQAPQEEVVERIVKVMRELKPQVVVTFDPIGGYRHPDHIAIHQATVAAFDAAGEAGRFPETGPIWAPQKLYFSIFPRKLLKIAVRLMPLFGRDPRHFGKNGDIDLTQLTNVNFPVHATVRLSRRSAELRDAAAACHASQSGGRPPRREMFGMLVRLFGERDLFMRSYPAVRGKLREHDLFEGTT